MTTVDELRGRFPQWTIRQDPDPDCYACKGSGVIKDRAPCFCAVSSEPHGKGKREAMQAIGNAARRIRGRESK